MEILTWDATFSHVKTLLRIYMTNLAVQNTRHMLYQIKPRSFYTKEYNVFIVESKGWSYSIFAVGWLNFLKNMHIY